MLKRRALFLLLLALWTVSCPAAARPKLVFLLVIDQFRADYLERFRADFVPGGFNRLLTRGAVFSNTNYDYASTETAPGHATISTGANPASHGIIGNEWYDRGLGRIVTSVEDSNYKLVGMDSTGPGASPRNLMGTSLSDELRLATGGKARVMGISLKDRSAILPAGKNPTAVFWMDKTSGRTVTSTYYTDKLPSWVADFNEKHNLLAFVGREWRALGAASTATPLAVIQKPAAEGPWVGPEGSPFANEALFELARQAVQEYQLGRGPTTDFLSLSLSPNDYVGHAVGPDSSMMRDMTLRSDRLLADFLRFLDAQAGPGNVLVVFTADHGVAPLPEVLKEKHIEAGRVGREEIAAAIEEALRKEYGGGAEEKWVVATGLPNVLPNVYLNQQLMEKYRVDPVEATRRAGEAALRVPGVFACFPADRLAGPPRSSMVARRAANSFFPGRTGDLFLVWKPFYHGAVWPNSGTNHVSPWGYDTHVPLIFMGSGFRPGVYQTPATPADLAPTVAAVLGINPPAVATGRVLAEALVVPVTEGNRQKAAGFGSKR